MSRPPRVGDIDEEDNILARKIRLTRNEYNATIRNKLEYNRLKTINKNMDNQNDFKSYKLQSTIQDLKKGLDDNQTVVCNINEFFLQRKVHSAAPHVRSREPGTRSDLARPNRDKNQSRAKSATTRTTRPFTAPLQTHSHDYIQQEDSESDDEAEPVDISRVTSAKTINNNRSTTASNSTFSVFPSDYSSEDFNTNSSSAPVVSHRITWPVRIRVFGLQDEDEARQQFLAWRADQRKTKPRRTSKQYVDLDLEKKYQTSIRRRKEIESFVTPELVEEHQLNDPVFAKRYRQLKLAVRAGKTPTYDPTDREIHVTMNKAKIERARTALITAKQTKIKKFYHDQQQMNDAQLSKRIDVFLQRLNKFKLQQTEI